MTESLIATEMTHDLRHVRFYWDALEDIQPALDHHEPGEWWFTTALTRTRVLWALEDGEHVPWFVSTAN